MLASHALVMLGVPLKRVVRRIRDVREDRYGLMRGFFHGGTDEVDESGESRGERLRSVPVHAGAFAIGKTLRQVDLEPLGAVVTVLRRQDQRITSPALETMVQEGDVLVLRGNSEELESAAMRLLQGVS
jgi:CPA2 family monovalent cation:H+ antiporter-2